MLKLKKFLPVFNRVLVERLEASTKTAGGIILQQKSESNIARVVETGEGNYEMGKLIPLSCKKGDFVVLPGYGGSSLKLADGKEYWIYRDDDLLGKVQE